jgi:hypothetical protein
MRRREQRYGMLAKDAEEGKDKREERRSQVPKSENFPQKSLVYIIDSDQRDAVFNSGIHSGKKVSDLVKTVEGRDFLGSVWKYGKRDLNSVIRKYFSD